MRFILFCCLRDKHHLYLICLIYQQESVRIYKMRRLFPFKIKVLQDNIYFKIYWSTNICTLTFCAESTHMLGNRERNWRIYLY